jgi:mannose-6-phosphate isomerase-like protein (cupin superfamily)
MARIEHALVAPRALAQSRRPLFELTWRHLIARIYTRIDLRKIQRTGYNVGMKHFNTAAVRSFFKPLYATRDCQAAMMTLKSGQSTTDQPEDEHPRSEQWLYVISGIGRAIVGKKRVALKEGSLLLIEKAEPHQITNTGKSPMVTINFYAPPAYTASGDVKPSAKAKR